MQLVLIQREFLAADAVSYKHNSQAVLQKQGRIFLVVHDLVIDEVSSHS